MYCNNLMLDSNSMQLGTVYILNIILTFIISAPNEPMESEFLMLQRKAKSICLLNEPI